MKPLLSSTLALLILCALPMQADATNIDATERFKRYVDEAVVLVKKTDDPDQKRAILNSTLDRMRRAANTVEKMPGLGDDDRTAARILSDNFSEKLAELNGEDGFERVADSELDEFADYVQQDLEQAQRLVISLSVTTLLLLIILILLIA